MWLQVNSAAADFKSLRCAILRYGVITIRATEASLDTGLVSVAAGGRSLSKRQCDQQNRYNDEQKHVFHRILLRFSPCGALEFHLGFDFASDPYAELARCVPVELPA
jgi:hypothetical protein